MPARSIANVPCRATDGKLFLEKTAPRKIAQLSAADGKIKLAIGPWRGNV
jgi:hypothetical protein